MRRLALLGALVVLPQPILATLALFGPTLARAIRGRRIATAH